MNYDPQMYILPGAYAEHAHRVEGYHRLGKSALYAVEIIAALGAMVAGVWLGANYLDNKHEQFLTNHAQLQYGAMPSIESTTVDGIGEVVIP